MEEWIDVSCQNLRLKEIIRLVVIRLEVIRLEISTIELYPYNSAPQQHTLFWIWTKKFYSQLFFLFFRKVLMEEWIDVSCQNWRLPEIKLNCFRDKMNFSVSLLSRQASVLINKMKYPYSEINKCFTRFYFQHSFKSKLFFMFNQAKSFQGSICELSWLHTIQLLDREVKVMKLIFVSFLLVLLVGVNSYDSNFQSFFIR